MMDATCLRASSGRKDRMPDKDKESLLTSNLCVSGIDFKKTDTDDSTTSDIMCDLE